MQNIQADSRKSKENMSKLNDAIELMERHVEEQRKNHERLIAAEISSRSCSHSFLMIQRFYARLLTEVLKVSNVYMQITAWQQGVQRVEC